MLRLGNATLARPASRRAFLGGLARGAAGLSLVPALNTAGSGSELLRAAADLAGPEKVGEAFWRLVKEQFTIKPNLILLNAANLCPSPHMVRTAVFHHTEDIDSDVSFQNRSKFDGLREEARRKLAGFLGASEDEIAIVRNTSEGNSLVVTGLPLKAGDEVLVFDQNHPTNNVAWDVRGARVGFTVKRIGFKPPENGEEIINLTREAISTRTRVLALTDLSNTTGLKLPVVELCRLARDRGIYTHIDGAQTFGSMPLNLGQLGCDSYASSAHKWFMGPKEAGILFVRKERIREIWPSIVGLGWGDSIEPDARGARKFETLGQRDDAAVASMGVTVDFHNMIGAARIQRRVLELSAALKEGAGGIPGARLRTPMNPELSGGVCVINFEGIDNRKLYEALYARYGIAGAPTGGVRLCPHVYNTMEEIDRAVSALSQVSREIG